MARTNWTKGVLAAAREALEEVEGRLAPLLAERAALERAVRALEGEPGEPLSEKDEAAEAEPPLKETNAATLRPVGRPKRRRRLGPSLEAVRRAVNERFAGAEFRSGEVADAMGLDRARRFAVGERLKRMTEAGELTRTGERFGTRYRLVAEEEQKPEDTEAVARRLRDWITREQRVGLPFPPAEAARALGYEDATASPFRRGAAYLKDRGVVEVLGAGRGTQWRYVRRVEDPDAAERTRAGQRDADAVTEADAPVRGFSIPGTSRHRAANVDRVPR